MAKLYKNHYDNTKLINSVDADGNKPAFYIVCSRERGPGKTFSFSKLLYEFMIERINTLNKLTGATAGYRLFDATTDNTTYAEHLSVQNDQTDMVIHDKVSYSNYISVIN